MGLGCFMWLGSVSVSVSDSVYLLPNRQLECGDVFVRMTAITKATGLNWSAGIHIITGRLAK